MVSVLIRTLSVLLLFFSAFGSCWLEPHDTPFNSLLPPRGWRFGNRDLLARANADCDEIDDPDTPDCRALCGAKGSPCNPVVAKRRDSRVRIRPEISNSTEVSPGELSVLRKRAFVPLYQADLPTYLEDQLAQDGDPDELYGAPEPLIDAAGDKNIVVQRQFANERFAVGTPNLCGCTVVTVVSNQAVHMGHYWESPSWQTDDDFETWVLDFFGAGGAPVGLGPVIDPALFPPASTRVYIMAPRKELDSGRPSRNFRSTTYVPKINTLKSQIIDVLGDVVPFFLYNYIVRDCELAEDVAFEGVTGKALFQFDPQGIEDGGVAQPGWRIYYEQHQFLSTDPENPDAEFGIPDT